MENYYGGSGTGLGGNTLHATGLNKSATGMSGTGAGPNVYVNSSTGLNGTHKNYSYLTNFKKGPKIKKPLQQHTTYGVAYNNSDNKKHDRGYPVYKFNIK